MTLDDLLTLAHGRTIVKADIEGAELPTLAPSQLKGVAAISVEAHGNEGALAKLLAAKGFHASIHRVPIPPSLFRLWLRTGPPWYTWAIALYRLAASTAAKPMVTIVKAYKPW